jgi:hypothetical protein
MYQELAGGLLLRGQEQERERLRTRIDRLRQLGGGDATGPGWRSPALAIMREPAPAHARTRGPSFWEWALAMRLAGTKG